MNSPNNNNNNLSIFKKKLFLLLFNILVLSNFSSFSQDEINPNGYNSFYYENGQLASEGNFKNGKPEGLWKSYYSDGDLKSEGYKSEGKSDSLWKFYSVDGKLDQTFLYRRGLKNGCAVRYDSLGNIASEGYYVNDVKQAEETWFYPNGNIKKTVLFKDGKETGLALEYNMDGIVITEEEYQNGYLRKREEFNRTDEAGNKIGKWRTYFENGNIKTEIGYNKGEKEGVSKEFDIDGKLVDIFKMRGDTIASDPGGVVMIDLYKEYHSNGKVKFVGGLNNGLKSGIFRAYNLNGDLINGYVYIKDTLVSEGMILPGGIFDSTWTTYYKTGKIKSRGTFNRGVKDGLWTYYYTNEKKEQEGKFKNNVLRGRWVWYYENGIVKKEESFNNKGLLEGTMIEYDSLGNELARGEYYNGKKEGSWFYQIGDYKEIGAFTLGEQDGVWNNYYLNGKIAFTGSYNEGEPAGKHIYYHDNGFKREFGKYAGGVKHGLWRTFNDKGELTETIRYKRGEINKINGFRVKEIEPVE
jgi:antitoxin component YwqK of YwqJK toxin-antitoxin module